MDVSTSDTLCAPEVECKALTWKAKEGECVSPVQGWEASGLAMSLLAPGSRVVAWDVN